MVDRIRRAIQTSREFLQNQVWEQEISRRPWIEAFALRQLRVGIIVVKGITSGNLALRASAMTYATLLSLVPLLVVAFTVFRAVGGLPDLEAKVEVWMLENIMPVHQEAMQNWMAGLLEDVKGGPSAVSPFFSSPAVSSDCSPRSRAPSTTSGECAAAARSSRGSPPTPRSSSPVPS